MKSKMLGALALLTLIGALFIMQSAGSSPPTADAATGTIAALNVGTCLTTDGDVFKGDCEPLMGVSGSDGWEVRDEIVEVSTLYATYAHDPKTASNEPRAILRDSDLIQISIADADRDKRTGVLIGSDTTSPLDSTADPPVTSPLGMAIKDDLGDLDFPSPATAEIAYTHADFDFITGGSPDNVIANSGNHTLNFTRANASSEQFHPGDFDVDGNGAIVRFYGCVSEDTSACGDDSDGEDDIQKLTGLEVDEDASNGQAHGNTAPWLGVNASVPDNHNIIILAIYYRTSNVEDLVGGETYRECSGDGAPSESNDVWSCPTGQNLSENGGEFDAVFTSDEKEDNDALVVRATADGSLEERSVNLYLRETARFSGVYQGFVRLTDDNGDGRDDNSDPKKTAIDNWGRKVGDGKGMEGVDEDDATRRGDAAIVAVESGPVTIEYRDSGGTMRRLRIEIDHQAPTINVTSPSHGSASGDQTPDFAGSLEDTESGLADNSFRLVVDNRVDSNGDARKNSDFALDGKAPDAGRSRYRVRPSHEHRRLHRL